MSGRMTTGQFSVAAAVYVKAEARRRLWGVIWLPALLLAATAVAGYFDNRFWFLGLLLLFIVYPMVLSLTWLSLASRPAMRWLLRPQKVIFEPGKTTVDFYGYDEDAPVVASLSLSDGDITDVEQTGKYVTVFLRENSFGIDFLLIPTEILSPDVNLFELIKE